MGFRGCSLQPPFVTAPKKSILPWLHDILATNLSDIVRIQQGLKILIQQKGEVGRSLYTIKVRSWSDPRVRGVGGLLSGGGVVVKKGGGLLKGGCCSGGRLLLGGLLLRGGCCFRMGWGVGTGWFGQGSIKANCKGEGKGKGKGQR